MKLFTLLLMALLMVESKVFAQQIETDMNVAPLPEHVKAVVDYYYSEQQKPLLADVKVCSGIYKSGVNKYDCLEEYPTDAVPMNQPLYVWMQYFVPKAGAEKLLLQLNYQGITRDALSFSVSGSIRYRVWQRVKFSREGAWQLPILLDNDAMEPLAQIQLNVVEPAAEALQLSEMQSSAANLTSETNEESY